MDFPLDLAIEELLNVLKALKSDGPPNNYKIGLMLLNYLYIKDLKHLFITQKPQL